MKFNLKSYSDLGKYCWPASMNCFDTEKDKVLILAVNADKKPSTCELPIESFEDLVPFLWKQPLIQGCDESKNMLYFTSTNPGCWWDDYPNEHIEERYKETLKLLRDENK